MFDFDDAIWMTEGKKQVSRKIEMSAMIFAGNEYLAEFASSYNKNVVIVPTTIDTEKLFPLNQPPEKFTIGWIGTETNFEYLKTIYQPLKIFLSANKETRLMIVSSHLPDFLKIDNGQMIFKQWEAEKENQYINQFSIGIMPLTDTEWTRGKCSYKMLQYMACGKPVVASPVGVNNKLFREAEIGIPAKTGDEWIRAFTRLKSDSVFFKTCAENGRALVEKDYSIDTYHPLILSYFKRISRQ
ncbi:MAG TPA: glycosyltransferase [Chitinophagaceae bacterium]